MTVERQALETILPYVDRMLAEYSDVVNEDPEKALMFFAFLFGGVSGLCMHLKMEAPQAHAVTLALYSTGLEMEPEDAAEMAQHGIDATSAKSPYNQAVHAGLDELFAYLADPAGFRPTRLASLI